ncbi:MAG: hypothetical protein L3J20_13775 [Flavobacteriaceae bacterium]|nr:hypothetical protein [Flavobacteriaceae bacterium]
MSKQFNYAYNAENFGYSDIKKLYSSDTINTKRSFFNSNSLQLVEVAIKSDIEKIILKQSTEGMLVCYQLLNPSLVIKSGRNTIDSNMIINELTKPIFVQMDAFGKVGVIKIDSNISEITSGIVKDIISRMQFVLPTEKAESWQTTEENTTGTYNAKYQITESNNLGKRYNKEILAYIKYKSKRENQKVKTDSKTTIVTDDIGTIRTINNSEAQIVLYNKDTLSVLGAKVSVFLTSETVIKNKIKDSLLNMEKSVRYGNETTLSEAASDERITKMSYAGTLGTDTWQQLIQQLSTANNLTKEEESSLLLKFRAIFYLYPENCSKAVSILNKEPYDTFIFKILSSALSITETVNATDALATIIANNKNDKKILADLMPVLATTNFPTFKAVDIIKSLAFNADEPQDYFIRSTAQLTLGGMANKFRLSDSLKSKELTHFLMGKMKFKKDTIQNLLVLGNTGSLTIFPYIKSLIEDNYASKQVKLEAVAALSLINYKEVSVYVNELLLNSDIDIKKKATEVLGFRNKYFE